MKGRRRSQFFLAGLMVMALVTPCWSLALTTFGKSNPQNTNNNNNNQNNDNKQQGPQAVARECASDSECAGVKHASCLEDIFGNGGGEKNKLRCLCGDYKAPNNGQCSNTDKRVKALCMRHDECIEGAICATGNSTELMGRRCWCTSSYMEDVDKMCSGSPVALGFSALSLVASLLLAGNV